MLYNYLGDGIFGVLEAKLKIEIHSKHVQLYKEANRDITDPQVMIELDQEFNDASRDECRNVAKKVRTQMRNIGVFIAKTFIEMYKKER